MSDFGQGKFVTARKSHRCDGCYGPIPKGEVYNRYDGVFDGHWQHWRMHKECHESMEEYGRATGEWEFTPGDAPVPKRIIELTQKGTNQ